MELTIYNDETPHEVMEQLRFILMEFGVVLETKDGPTKDSVTYEFTQAVPLDSEE
mgnify:CR=1 FL=1